VASSFHLETPTCGSGSQSFHSLAASPYDSTSNDFAVAARSNTNGVIWDGFLNGTRHLIHDRDPLFTSSFRDILRSSGVETVKLPARSPNLNAFAERFVRSIKSECLAQIIPLGERHLRHAVKEYTEHYHVERNHQGLEYRMIEEQQGVVDLNSAVARRKRLGGVLNYYERRAA
jgi:putative transposase